MTLGEEIIFPYPIHVKRRSDLVFARHIDSKERINDCFGDVQIRDGHLNIKPKKAGRY